LLEIPVKDTITLQQMSDVISELMSGSQSATQSWTEEQLLAVVVLLLKNKNHPYVSVTLPEEHYSFWTLPSDLWNQIILPRCYRESFQATRSSVLDFCATSLPIEEVSLQDKLWAFSMVRSRSISVPELQSNSKIDGDAPIGLVPGLDMFNHAFESGTLLQLNGIDETESGRQWTLSSSKSYKTGDQIFLSYGDEKDNWKLLLVYGFAIPQNPNPLVFWTWQDLLEAAGQVRPMVFPERAQKQLLKHPQLYETYTKLSENRASFSYNAHMKAPRESLENGLLMISNLAAQLGHDNDNALSQDVMNQLIRNRLQELKVSLNSIEEISVPSEWTPFLESMSLTLKEEEAYLNESN
jgi:hypothetical protein